VLAFSDLRRATYCPRQLWYARRGDDRAPPEDVVAVKRLARRYEELLDAPTHPEPAGAIADAPIAVPAAVWQERVAAARERHDRFPDLVAPAATEAFLAGRECHGIASKVLPDPPVPSLVSPGKPPENGVWKRHGVWAVAAAKALAWERETRIDAAFVEYPAYGVIRRVRLTTRKKARYRKAIRTVESLDAPPPRVDDSAKCESCEYAAECGVETRTLRSRLAGR
jgi:CRISPR-associated exonuclease Cas4